MKMKDVLCIALLCAVGCAGVPTEPMAGGGAVPAFQEESEGDISNWIPGLIEDLWETLDANIGTGYGFGVHVKATEWLRIGIFDHADFGLLGVESKIFEGEYTCPWNEEDADPMGTMWDLSAKFGMGFGMSFTVHTWEIIDFISSVVGLGYWSLDED